ncbi:hypothetical protein LPW11_08545 [Geomonas sp. RF6]|uniref:hypothetical protein n=1 Tax=Geomonas sp. RF6 TaxID=2897342 RepID=UPI001E3F2BEC|nr:hypothetical protein [Geomonas sp. RF6]UFS72228.1 hypothetical protein LPW11_08545 [Geomonas sp. RF6]
MKRGAWGLVIAMALTCSVAANAETVKGGSGGIMQEAGVATAASKGYCNLRITASLKTHTPGVHSTPDLHGTPEYKLLLKIDGKDVPLPATLRQEETEMRRLADAEVGAGMLYSFYNNVPIPAGRHEIVLAIPADKVVVEREITLAEGSSNTLSFEPEYRWAPGKERLRFYGTTSYKEGIKGFTVVLNGKAL